MARAWRPVASVVILAAIVGLWLLPNAFPNPGTNDAIWLSSMEIPVFLVGIVGLVIALAVFRGSRGTVVRVALGVFLLGSALSFVAGLFAFCNLSDDRCAPLLFAPFPFGLAGVVALVVGLTLSGRRLRDILVGLAYGVAAALVFLVWFLARGSRDWLLAPYGFDIVALILVLGAAVAVLGSTRFLTGRG